MTRNQWILVILAGGVALYFLYSPFKNMVNANVSKVRAFLKV